MRSSVLVSTVFLAIAAACSPPHRDVPAKDIPQLGDLEDVMDVQATVADPWFKKTGQASYTDADYATLADVSERIQATSARAKAFSKGPGFDELTDRLGREAKDLGDAAAKKDAKASSDALTNMKITCKECHTKFR